MKRTPEQELIDAALFGAELGSGVPTVDLHGLSVHEALRELDTFIGQRHVAGAAVRIIHGKGSQKLRDAVQDWLKKHPKDIAGYRDSGNPAETGGVTVAVLTA